MPDSARKKTTAKPRSKSAVTRSHQGRRKVKIGRPSLADAGLVDQAILDVAAGVFLANGYANASMDAVAVGARVSKRTLYARYANKDALFEAVVDNRLAAWSADASLTNDLAGDTLESRLRFFLGNMVRWGVTEEVRAYDRLLGTAPSATARKLFERRYQSMVNTLAAEIDRYTRAEGKPARNAHGVAFDLMALIAGWFRFHAHVEPASVADATAFANHAVDLLFAARSSW